MPEEGSSSARANLEATPKPGTSRSTHEKQNLTLPDAPTAIPGSTDRSGVPAESTRSDFAMQGDDSGLGSGENIHSCMFLPFHVCFSYLSYLTAGSRGVKERRETSVFPSGGPTATGRYEAAFQPDSTTIRNSRERRSSSGLEKNGPSRNFFFFFFFSTD